MGAGAVMYEDPADRHQAMARLVPMRLPADHFHAPDRATIPAHPQALALGTCHHLVGCGLLGAFRAGPSDFGSDAASWRRGVEIGGGVETADQCQVATIPVSKARQFVGAVAAIARQQELPLGQPVRQDRRQLTEQAWWGFVS